MMMFGRWLVVIDELGVISRHLTKRAAQDRADELNQARRPAGVPLASVVHVSQRDKRA